MGDEKETKMDVETISGFYCHTNQYVDYIFKKNVQLLTAYQRGICLTHAKMHFITVLLTFRLGKIPFFETKYVVLASHLWLLFRYLRIDGGMKQDFVHKNSQAREERIKALTAEKIPKTVDDVLSIMGDTANYRHPIWRLGKFPDQWATMSLGIQYFFFNFKTVAIRYCIN